MLLRRLAKAPSIQVHRRPQPALKSNFHFVNGRQGGEKREFFKINKTVADFGCYVVLISSPLFNLQIQIHIKWVLYN